MQQQSSPGAGPSRARAASTLPLVPKEMIGGIEIATLDRKATARCMADVALAARGRGEPAVVCTSANGQVLAEAFVGKNRQKVSEQLRQAYIVNADGQPLVFASRLLGGGGLTERSATTDLFHDVAGIAVAEGLTFYMLGASPQECKVAVDNVRRLYPGLRIAGARNGYFASPEEERQAIAEIDALKPDILWVAMGFPRELDFCLRWQGELRHVGVVKTSGGLFNFLSGTNSRAPAWMQAAGLEWAYRLLLEPRRLFLRYATTNVAAIWLLLTKTRRTV